MTLDEVVDGLNAQGPAWLWFGIGMRNGDMHHAAGLARAFKAQHGDDLPIRLVVTTRPQEMVGRVWERHFASIQTQPDLIVSYRDITDFFASRGLPFFGPGVPLLLHPDLSPRTWSLHGFTAQNRIVWGQLYKSALELPAYVEPEFPPASAERTARARALLAEAELPAGRTMLLFPYAQSFPVSALDHFARLADDARAKGWTAVTSVAPGEEPVSGTAGVFIPFDILLETAEEAGWVVAIRSGICDITASARAKKTFIFRERNELPVWGVDALELARDARQIVVRFEIETPANFSARVFGEEADRAPVPRRTLSDMAVEGGGAGAVTFAAHAADGLKGGGKRGLFKSRPPLVRVLDMPARDHPRWADLARELAATLADLAGRDGRLYACRDAKLGLDFFEEVDAASLRTGRYAAASGWHTLLATDKAGLAPRLPETLRSKLLERGVFELGHFQNLGRSFATPAHLALVTGDRPVDLDGVQLLSGWSDLEPWGVWSVGDVSVLKFSVAQPTTSPVTLELEGKLIVTQPDGVLPFRVQVNGVELLARDVLQHEHVNLRVTIPPELLVDRTAYVEFRHPRARSSVRLGEGQDDRRLCFGLTAVNLRHGS